MSALLYFTIPLIPGAGSTTLSLKSGKASIKPACIIYSELNIQSSKMKAQSDMINKISSKIFTEIINFIKSLYSNENPVPLHAPRFTGNERKYVVDAIDSTFVSSVGKYVDRFEKMICEITGAKYAIATVNGTCALHIALKLAGV